MLTILLAIAALHWIVLVTPGVNMLLVSQLAASGQRSKACLAALGVTCVALLWSVLAVLGVGTVFTIYPSLRQALQLGGAIYLLSVAVRLWRASPQNAQASCHRLSHVAAFRMGFFTNLMNPKSALFFGSMFATALPEAPSNQLMMAAVCMSTTNTLCWHLFLAIVFSHARVRAVYSSHSRVLGRIAGALVGAFGVRLLVATVQEVRAR